MEKNFKNIMDVSLDYNELQIRDNCNMYAIRKSRNQHSNYYR